MRVFVLAEIRIYREGLSQFLSRQEGVEVVGSGSSWPAASAALAEAGPDIALVDMRMPGSLEAVETMAHRACGPRVVALGVAERDDEVIACAEAGVSGYVTRDESLSHLTRVLFGVLEGAIPCSPRMAAALLQRVSSLAAERAPAGPRAALTRRETEIVELIDRGLSNKEIARRLCIELPTVKNHVHNILGKLQVHRRGEAAARVRAPLMARGARPRD
jgi:two-component system, NarL family, nitrate/nitrite response regulator NarL